MEAITLVLVGVVIGMLLAIKAIDPMGGVK